MAYPETCFTNLIAVKGVCNEQTASYYLNDIPGIDLSKLAEVAEADSPTGQKLAERLIESAARIMAADVEAIYDGQYKVENTLVSGCSTCTFTSNYSAGNKLGVLVKNNTESSFSRILIDRLTAKINDTGTFHIQIDDGDPNNLRSIPWDFEAGVEYDFQGINYVTRKKSVTIYMLEPAAPLAQLSCKRGGSGCGCSGAATVVSDLVYTGTLNGAEQQQAYGFQPCALIMCDAADLLCFIAHSAPRMIGMALLYKTAALYFDTVLHANRNNKTVGTNTDQVEEDLKRYDKLYKDKLDGSKTRGVKDLVFTTLQQTSDVCVICNSLLGTAWATG